MQIRRSSIVQRSGMPWPWHQRDSFGGIVALPGLSGILHFLIFTGGESQENAITCCSLNCAAVFCRFRCRSDKPQAQPKSSIRYESASQSPGSIICLADGDVCPVRVLSISEGMSKGIVRCRANVRDRGGVILRRLRRWGSACRRTGEYSRQNCITGITVVACSVRFGSAAAQGPGLGLRRKSKDPRHYAADESIFSQ